MDNLPYCRRLMGSFRSKTNPHRHIVVKCGDPTNVGTSGIVRCQSCIDGGALIEICYLCFRKKTIWRYDVLVQGNVCQECVEKDVSCGRDPDSYYDYPQIRREYELHL